MRWLMAILIALAIDRIGFAEQSQLPDAVKGSRALIAARDPTTRPFSYEAEYELTWHAKLVYDESLNIPSDAPQQSRNAVRLRSPVKLPRIVAIEPPATSSGTIRVEQSGNNVTIQITPTRTAPEHLQFHQLRQAITIWQNDEELGEIRQSEQTACIDVLPSNRVPWPDQFLIPHVIFTSCLAPDWNRKFPRMFIIYNTLEEDFPVTTHVRQEGADTLVSESFTRAGMLTRYGPYSQERLTRYSLVGRQLLPTEIVRINSGVKDLVARIDWPGDNASDPSQPLMPTLVEFLSFAPPPDKSSALVLSERQVFRIKADTVRFGANGAGQVAVPDGFTVLKRFPKGDPRESEEYIATGAAVAPVEPFDRPSLLAFGGVIVILILVGVSITVLQKRQDFRHRT